MEQTLRNISVCLSWDGFTEWSELERTLKVTQFQLPCCGQRHLPLAQAAQVSLAVKMRKAVLRTWRPPSSCSQEPFQHRAQLLRHTEHLQRMAREKIQHPALLFSPRALKGASVDVKGLLPSHIPEIQLQKTSHPGCLWPPGHGGKGHDGVFVRHSLPAVSFGGQCAGAGQRQKEELCALQSQCSSLDILRVPSRSRASARRTESQAQQNDTKPCLALCSTSSSCALS